VSGAIFMCGNCAGPYHRKAEELSIGNIIGTCEKCGGPLHGSPAQPVICINYYAFRRTDVERIDKENQCQS
jgi:hypothetical protein